MNCLASIIKYILYIFNIIFLICGLLLIIFGSIMLANIGDFSSFEEAVNTDTVPILVLVLGIIVFIISFFGCCGAIRENKCCLMIYAIFLFIVFVLQLTLVVWAFVKYEDFLNTADNIVHKAFEQNNQAQGYPMDALQLSFKCCGVNGYSDYKQNNQDIPNSCCGNRDKVCPADVYVTKPGCLGEFHDFWSTNMNIIRYAGMGVALVELVALTFTCVLINNIRRN